MAPEIGLKSYGGFEKRAPGPRQTQRLNQHAWWTNNGKAETLVYNKCLVYIIISCVNFGVYWRNESQNWRYVQRTSESLSQRKPTCCNRTVHHPVTSDWRTWWCSWTDQTHGIGIVFNFALSFSTPHTPWHFRFLSAYLTERLMHLQVVCWCDNFTLLPQITPHTLRPSVAITSNYTKYP